MAGLFRSEPSAISNIMLRFLFIASIVALSGCRDESVAAYGAGDAIWTLHSIDGQRAPANVTLSFPETGRIAGQAPCNSYSGKLDAPYPWFEVTDLTATRIACPNLEAEGTYFAALMTMTQSEVSGHVLILRNDAGHEMEFRSGE